MFLLYKLLASTLVLISKMHPLCVKWDGTLSPLTHSLPPFWGLNIKVFKFQK